MAPEKRVYDIVSANLDIADKVYIGTPDFNNQTSVTPESLAPWVRITSLPGDGADYADDSRILEYPKVQVDFWVDNTDWDQENRNTDISSTTCGWLGKVLSQLLR